MINNPLQVPDASETVKGVSELATNTEALTGTDTTRAVTPANVKYVLNNTPASSSVKGLVELATDAETKAGTDTTRAITPANLKASIGITKRYITAELSITSLGTQTIAHGLGAGARVDTAYLVCKTAASGYAVGDKIPTSFGNPTGTVGCGIGVNSSNIKVKFVNSASVFNAVNLSTGAWDYLTNTSFKLVIEVIN